MPLSRSIFKNFLQNLEGKFIKSSSKSKALIHYHTGCPRRHVHLPYLFHLTRTVWIQQIPVGPLMDLTELYASSHPLWFLPWNSWCSRDAGISKITHNAALVHGLLSGVLKLGRLGHHSIEGNVVQPQPIHWPVNDSLRNSHTVRVKCAGALSCWNDTCYIIPFLLGSGIIQGYS